RRCSSFFALIRPPLRSTLFPYTTLFRSAPEGDHDPPRPRGGQDDRRAVGRGDGRMADGQLRRGLVRVERPLSRSGAKLLAQRCRDRKSTRLNSSHVKISYAVFCLKKKKK